MLLLRYIIKKYRHKHEIRFLNFWDKKHYIMKLSDVQFYNYCLKKNN